MAEFSLKRGEIPKAIKQEETGGRTKLWDIDISIFVVDDIYIFLKSIKLTCVGSKS